MDEGLPVIDSLLGQTWAWVQAVLGPNRMVDASPPCKLGLHHRAVGIVCISSAISLVCVSIAQAGGRADLPWAQPLFWVAFCALFAGPVYRGVEPRTSRAERIVMIMIASLMAFAVKQIYSPTSFAHFDEYLHWVTLDAIVNTGRTFNENTLLPISPFYPALELCAAALKLLSGANDFVSASVIVALSRLLTVLLLFRLVERVTASSRAASIATFAFMGNSAFVFFDQQFAYETLAFPLFCACLFLCSSINGQQHSLRKTRLTSLLLVTVILGLTLTHHLTSFISGCYVATILFCDYLLGRRAHRAHALIIALFAIMAPVLWSRLSGAPTGTYLGPSFVLASFDIANLFSGASSMRGLFVSSTGPATPLALKLGGVIGTALIAIGLATGFFRSIQRGLGSALSFNFIELRRRVRKRAVVSSALVVLALSTLLFPVSVALRLTPKGWELGNRLGPFIFVSVSIVLGVAIRYFWQRRSTVLFTGGITVTIITIIFSGMVSGWGVDALRGPYQISADALSIERMGISAARWTAAELGPGHRFASDRINQILLAGHGKQISLTSISDQIEVSRLFMSDSWGAEERNIVSLARLDFLLVDLRLTGGRPKFGYFDSPPEDPVAELRVRSLLKFGSVSGVSRIYDNGYIIIYDVRAINGRAPR